MSKALAPSVTTRDPKGLKFISIVEAAYNKASLCEEEAQRVNEAPGLAEHIDGFIAEHRQLGQYANEEVRSGYRYPKEYQGPKPVADQIKVIAKIFGLDSIQAIEFAKNLPALPDGAEGWFAIPSVDALAKKHFPEVTDPAQKYCQAVQLVHAKIAASRSFCNYREGQITTAQFRLSARTAHPMDLIAETQEASDILIFAAQLGMRHRGKSVRRAREVFAANEFGLGTFAIGIMLLTHPEREVQWEQLHVDCAGDEFSPDTDGVFSSAPVFDFHDGRVGFVAYWFGGARGRYGSASAFLSQ